MEMRTIHPTEKTFTPRLLPFVVALALLSCKNKELSTAVATTSASVEQEAAGLHDHGRNASIYQHTSAEVHLMFRQAYELARIKLERNLSEAQGKPTAVILDVDETVLDNSRYEMERIATGETYTPDTWKEWVERREATALPGALEFIQFARSKGCDIYYLTNRKADEEVATIDNLLKLGFPQADSVHVITKTTTSDKTTRRASVSATHEVVLFVGDQLTDFNQLYKERSVNYGKNKVEANYEELERYFVLTPNAVYGTWKDAVSGRGSSAERIQRIKEWFKAFEQK